MRYDDYTSSYKSPEEAMAAWRPEACLLVAHEPHNRPGIDRHRFKRRIRVGRERDVDVRLDDNSVSRQHFRIDVRDDVFYLADLGSKNGTFVEGERITDAVAIEDGALIRAGHGLFVFHADARPFFDHPRIDDHGMAGPFHTAPLMRELKEAVSAGRNILLAGPTGSGKELCARAVAAMAGRPLIAHNAARSTSEDEARASLFGVGPKVFSDVVERAGFIERADGGVLFLDEADALPWSVQKSLLRVLEDGVLTRIGETDERRVDVEFVLASNAPGPDHGLADDLVARLRQVKVPGLAERRADIPAIFDHLLYRVYERLDIDAPRDYDLLTGVHYETMILDGFTRQNARGLYDLAERIAARIKQIQYPELTASEVMAEHYGRRFVPVERDYTAEEQAELNGRLTSELPVTLQAPVDDRELVEQAFHRLGGRVSVIQEHLQAKGIEISWKRVARILDELGLPRIKRERG